MKQWLIGLSALALIGTAVPSVLAADSLQRPQSSITTHSKSSTDGDPGVRPHQIDVRSSVQISQETLRDAYEASRQAYTKKLQKFAKCASKDAEKAVHAVHPGMKITELELRTIRRSLVYVARTEDDDTSYLVIVDAGNGKVLMDKLLPTHHERVFAGH